KQAWLRKAPHATPQVVTTRATASTSDGVWQVVPASNNGVTSNRVVLDKPVSLKSKCSNKFSVLDASDDDESLLDHSDMVECNYADISLS
ncbi:hypothetical protein, partial [Klebsiella pneumoniae]|uniref:hypothetical protein n=1 Tax=Klebsiella pneumoniae TaxID=573 RepID=UPI001BDFEC77